jgi:hypothetical protein
LLPISFAGSRHLVLFMELAVKPNPGSKTTFDA